MVLDAISLFLLSTMTPALPVAAVCGYTAIMGVGLGMTMQNLVLVVQNAFPRRMVGTATSSNNYFRQIGASPGSAVVGSVFASNLAGLLADRLSAAGGTAADSASDFTPALVHGLPEQVQDVIIGSYNDALTPVFLALVPLALLAAVVLAFIKPAPLAQTVETTTDLTVDTVGAVDTVVPELVGATASAVPSAPAGAGGDADRRPPGAGRG